MRRFLIPIIVFAFVSWGIFLILLKFTSPFLPTTNHQLPTTNYRQVTFFLTVLFSVLTFTFTLILYFFYRFIGVPPGDGRQTMRRSLRQSFFISLGITTLAILQLTKTLNPLTFILTVAIAIALEFTFRSGKEKANRE